MMNAATTSEEPSRTVMEIEAESAIAFFFSVGLVWFGLNALVYDGGRVFGVGVGVEPASAVVMVEVWWRL